MQLALKCSVNIPMKTGAGGYNHAIVEIWMRERTRMRLETLVAPKPAHLLAYLEACREAAATASRRTDGTWSPSALEIAHWGIHCYLREPQPWAGGQKDQDYPFTLLATRPERLNSYKLPTQPWCRGTAQAPPAREEPEEPATASDPARYIPPDILADFEERLRQNDQRGLGGMRPR